MISQVLTWPYDKELSQEYVPSLPNVHDYRAFGRALFQDTIQT